MIVRDFLDWVRTAPAGKRAEATGALARAYLYSDLSPDDLGAAEGAMLMLLDDPSPLVRRALADVLAASPSAPPAIVLALAADQPEIAAPVLALSPLFVDADLVDAVATGTPAVQTAIASRAALPRSVAAAIAEVGTAESCLALAGESAMPTLRRSRSIGSSSASATSPPIREALLARDDLSQRPRARFWSPSCRRRWPASSPSANGWTPISAQRIAREACEKATVVARGGNADERRCAPLIRHLRVSGQLTAGLILRALLSGNVVLFEEALAELTDMPVARVSASSTTAATRRCGRCSTGPGCRLDLSGLQGGDRGDARGRFHRRTRRRRAASSAA